MTTSTPRRLGVRAAWLATALIATACSTPEPAPSADNPATLPAGASATSTAPVPNAATTTAPDSLAVAAARDSAAQDFAARDSAAVRPTLPIAEARVEVELSRRTLRLYRGTELVATHPVAVGSAEWPTRTGEWNITQVIFNPEWIPPDESWAEEREPRKPGDPENPLGRAQLVYDPPRSIHGTNDPKSIGKAVSHGSIRVTNTVARQLARQLMEMTGVTRDDAWFKDTERNRTVKQIVDLPQWVPIRVY